MKKAELKERLSAIERKVFEAKIDAEELLEELEEDQARIRDDDIDAINHFVSDCETASSTILQI